MVIVGITITIYTNQLEVPYTLLSSLLLNKGLSNLLLSTFYLEVLRMLNK